MKTHLKKILLTGAAALAMLVSTSAVQADATVQVGNSTAPWLGFMNVFELDGTTPAGVNSGWGVSDLVVTFQDLASMLTFSPNTIGDPSPFWYQGGGGPGAPGNKIMEANLFVQIDDALAGQLVTFEYTGLTNTLTSAHVASVFIRDFAPDFSSFNETFVPFALGTNSISLNTDPGAGRHVQYGFQMKGVNVWETDVAPFGNFTVQTIPEPGSFAILGMAGLGLIARRRRG